MPAHPEVLVEQRKPSQRWEPQQHSDFPVGPGRSDERRSAQWNMRPGCRFGHVVKAREELGLEELGPGAASQMTFRVIGCLVTIAEEAPRSRWAS